MLSPLLHDPTHFVFFSSAFKCKNLGLVHLECFSSLYSSIPDVLPSRVAYRCRVGLALQNIVIEIYIVALNSSIGLLIVFWV